MSDISYAQELNASLIVVNDRDSITYLDIFVGKRISLKKHTHLKTKIYLTKNTAFIMLSLRIFVILK